MDTNELKELIGKVSQGTASEQELGRYNAYMNRLTRGGAGWDSLDLGDRKAVEQELWDRINSNRHIVRPITRWRWVAAASILLIIGFGGYFTLKPKHPNIASDIAPGTRQVILKTGHGRTLILDPKKKGLLAQFGATNINQDGKTINYTGSDQQTVYDTLEVPAGGIPYTLRLGDGSKIILNVASSLRFPEHFSKSSREGLQLLSGEVYCEIEHIPGSALRIQTPKGLITDIGTTLNISAYPDDPDSRITLVEGSIAVSAVALKPGDQAILTGGTLRISRPDLDEVLSWKNGEFAFEHEDLASIMRTLSRWYNVRVIYTGGKPGTEEFSGTISRFGNISTVLNMLQKTSKVRFGLEGNKLTVHTPDQLK